MSACRDTVGALLRTLDTITGDQGDHVKAHGVMLLEATTVMAAAGFSGQSLAAPIAIVERLDGSTLAPNVIVLHNDPHAGGVSLNHVFMLTQAGIRGRYLIAALSFADFGAMRRNVFRRQAETFHEGLSLSLLPVDWDGPIRQMALRVIEANVRHGSAARTVIDKSARSVLTAAAALVPAALASVPSITVPAGRGEGSAPVAEDGTLSVLARWSSGEPSAQADLRLELSRAQTRGQIARCSATSARSAAVLGVADALGVSWQDLTMLRIDAADVAAFAPEAVADGLPIAFACYRAAFASMCGLDISQGMPRSIEAFTESLVSR